MRRLAPLLLALGTACAPADGPRDTLADALGRLGAAFEAGDADRMAGLYPEGWAVIALAGEPWRSVTGDELRRRLGVLFRQRASVAWTERPGSIRRSADGRFAILSAEWRSMEIGNDRPLRERFRIALELGGRGEEGWRVREITAWARR